MKGTLTLPHDQVAQAIEYWLNQTQLKDAVKVTSVKAKGGGNSASEFEISVAMPLPESINTTASEDRPSQDQSG